MAISSAGVKINLNVWDGGEIAFIFVPGTGCASEFYSPFLQRLNEVGYMVVGLDPKGHGRSEGRRGDFSIEEVIENIKDAVDFARPKKVVLMGSSQGGIISLYALMEGLEVETSVLHNAAIIPDNVRELVLKSLEGRSDDDKVPTFWVRWDKVFESEDLRKAFMDDPLFVGEYTIRSAKSLFTFKPRKNNVKCPVLIVVGEREEVVPNFLAKEVFEILPGPKKYVEIKGAGHMILLENIDETLKVVDDWVKSVIV